MGVQDLVPISGGGGRGEKQDEQPRVSALYHYLQKSGSSGKGASYNVIGELKAKD